MNNGSSTASADDQAERRVVEPSQMPSEKCADGQLDNEPNEKTGVRTSSSARIEAAKRVHRDSVDEGWELDGSADNAVARPAKSQVSKSDVSRTVNSSKFPSAMAVIAREEAASASLPTAAEVPTAAVPAAVKIESTVKTESSVKSVAPLAGMPVVSISAPPTSSPSASTGEAAPSASEVDAAQPTSASAGKVDAAQSTSASASEVEPAKAPSASEVEAVQPTRAKQESLLSLEADDVVAFFSSPPPAVDESQQLELEAIPEPPRSLFPPAELRKRQAYFRGVVVKVMLAALMLFAFALYVLWRRGVFVHYLG